MEFNDFVHSDGIFAALDLSSKKQALQFLAQQAAKLTGADEELIFDTLIARERLGTTGVGSGVAIPHGKIPGLDRLVGMVAVLQNPIDFDSIDGRPVDILFLLLVPEDAGAAHLKALAKISRLLRQEECRERLRRAASAAQVLEVLEEGQGDASGAINRDANAAG